MNLIMNGGYPARAKLGTRNPKPDTQDPESKVRNLKPVWLVPKGPKL